MVRFATLSLTAILGAVTLAAQSYSQNSGGIVSMTPGQVQGQPAPETNAAGNGLKPRTFVLLPPDKSGKRLFRYQFEPPQIGSNVPGVFVLPSPTATCPVSMRAEHRGGGGVITTGKGAAGAIAQHIHLILGKILSESGSSTRVTAATVTVSGTNGKWRMENASQFQAHPQPASPYISTTLNVAFAKGGDEPESSDLDLPGFTSVKSIRLDSLTFADGSTWAPADGRSCRIEPDPLRLVSSR